MKYFGIFALSLLFNMAFSQEIRFVDLASSKKGKYTSYLASDGHVYKTGERIKIGMPGANHTFDFITEGDGTLIPVTHLTSDISGQESEILTIRVTGSKRTGYQVVMRTRGAGFSQYTIQFENALEAGEIKGFGMTETQALETLKKAKDKLDLGLISADEYENIKENVRQYIK